MNGIKARRGRSIRTRKRKVKDLINFFKSSESICPEKYSNSNIHPEEIDENVNNVQIESSISSLKLPTQHLNSVE